MRLILLLLLPCFCFSQKYFVDDSKVSFYSWAPLEDISAISNKLEGVVDFDSGDFFFRIPISTFIFPSSLMQKHFNEKYMESDIYSMSSFKGNFNEKVSVTKNQEINISAEGILNIHGIDQDVVIETNLKVSNSEVLFDSKFDVFLNHALKLDADFVATGHYANKIINSKKIEHCDLNEEFMA